MLAVLSAMMHVGHVYVNILQHLQSYRQSGTSIKLFLKLSIQFS